MERKLLDFCMYDCCVVADAGFGVACVDETAACNAAICGGTACTTGDVADMSIVAWFGTVVPIVDCGPGTGGEVAWIVALETSRAAPGEVGAMFGLNGCVRTVPGFEDTVARRGVAAGTLLGGAPCNRGIDEALLC